MSQRYNHKKTESHWQKKWLESKVFQTSKEDNKETGLGAINIPTIQVNKTNDITLGFIKLKNDCKLKAKLNLVLLRFVNI